MGLKAFLDGGGNRRNHRGSGGWGSSSIGFSLDSSNLGGNYLWTEGSGSGDGEHGQGHGEEVRSHLNYDRVIVFFCLLL
jgi:hypothetical protein